LARVDLVSAAIRSFDGLPFPLNPGIGVERE
jgi:hypothetical protein